MAVIATGVFDGVHLGHRKVIQTLVSCARERGEESLVLTFWPHPRVVFQNGARELKLLNSLNEKIAIMRSLGVDRVEVIPFDAGYAAMNAAAYMEKIVKDKFGGTCIVLGYDNRLGCDMLGYEALNPIAESLGLDTVVVDKATAGLLPSLSSTTIRNLIAEGNVSIASEMLGYQYSLEGVVVSGNQFGRTIGFPTANMQLYEPLKAVPANGVYLSAVSVAGFSGYGMTNIGVRPTIAPGSSIITIETNIFDFDKNIYGLPITIKFMQRIRDEIKFPSVGALKAQLESDCCDCHRILSEL